MNNYTLVWWQEKFVSLSILLIHYTELDYDSAFGWQNGYYMLLYAMLGIGNAVFTFGLGAAMGWESYLASRSLHHDALSRVFHAPMVFFDTTVRLVNHFS